MHLLRVKTVLLVWVQFLEMRMTVIGGLTRRMSVSTHLEVECTALYWGLKLLDMWNIANGILESDSKVAVEWLTKESLDIWKMMSIDIWVLLCLGSQLEGHRERHCQLRSRSGTK